MKSGHDDRISLRQHIVTDRKLAVFDTKRLVIIAMLTAIEIVLSRFCSISAWNLKIGFGFAPVLVAAMLYGPIEAAAVGGLADFLGAVLFPIGPYFPGFTITAALTGAVFGAFLKRRPEKTRDLPSESEGSAERKSFGFGARLVVSVLINQLVLSLLLNTLWISVLYGSPFVPLLATRIVQCAVMVPVQIVTAVAIHKIKLPFIE